MNRLDVILVERGICKNLNEAGAWVLRGKVRSGGAVLDKPGTKMAPDVPLEVDSKEIPYVSRGGLKLDHGLRAFNLDVEGLVCMDIGASTGGFTDCLLKKGASRVISVDVAYGKLDMKLRNDSRVLMLERTHACSLFPSQLPPAFSDPKVFTVDVSFISSERILSHLAKAFASLQMGILLYKPQFELERSLIGKGGLVRDPQCIPQHIQDWKSRLLKQGWQAPKSDEISPIAGKKSGNLEYLVYLDRTTPC